MKTLDEVIKAFEHCISQVAEIDNCIGCPYENEKTGCHQRNLDALHYLKILKAKSEEPPIGEPPDYISLDFYHLAKMIGEPVYFKERGCMGHWEIVTAVRKTADGEEVAIRGSNSWKRIEKQIYRTKEGAEG